MPAICDRIIPVGVRPMELEAALKLIETQKAEAEKAKADMTAMQSKLDELLGETKKAKQKAKDAEDAAEQERLDKARKDGDHDSIIAAIEKERDLYKSKVDELTISGEKERAKTAKEKTKTVAMKIASELADGVNAELLSDFVERRIKHIDGELKVLDASGELTISTVDDLKKEFQKGERYVSLIRGSQASGGGANGGNGSAGDKKFSDYSGAELKDIRKNDPDEYNRIKQTK